MLYNNTDVIIFEQKVDSSYYLLKNAYSNSQSSDGKLICSLPDHYTVLISLHLSIYSQQYLIVNQIGCHE